MKQAAVGCGNPECLPFYASVFLCIGPDRTLHLLLRMLCALPLPFFSSCFVLRFLMQDVCALVYDVPLCTMVGMCWATERPCNCPEHAL